MVERRAVPRIEPKQPLAASVFIDQPARILDISSRGAQIELAAALRPSGACDLRIRFAEAEFAARAKVLRCRAWEVGEDDHRGILYRAGLQFDELDPESLACLSSNVLYAEA